MRKIKQPNSTTQEPLLRQNSLAHAHTLTHTHTHSHFYDIFTERSTREIKCHCLEGVLPGARPIDLSGPIRQGLREGSANER